MRVLLDECMDKGLRRFLAGHDCQTLPVRRAQGGLGNGVLVAAAEKAGFEVLITVDRSSANQLKRMLGISYKRAGTAAFAFVRYGRDESGVEQWSAMSPILAIALAASAGRILTDDCPAYQQISDQRHEARDGQSSPLRMGARRSPHKSMKGVGLLLKRSILGSDHRVGGKHLDAYLTSARIRICFAPRYSHDQVARIEFKELTRDIT